MTPRPIHQAFAGWAAGLLTSSCVLVAASQPPEIEPNDFRISFSATGFRSEKTSAAYNPHRGEYLVVWEVRGPLFSLVGRRVAADGTLLGQPLTLSTGDAFDPAVAFNDNDRRYLVAWWDAETEQVVGRLLDDSGGFFGPQFSIRNCDFNEIGVGSCQPAVVYAAAQNVFLVVWVEETGISDIEVRGRRLDGATGLPLDAEPVPIALTGDFLAEPAVAYNSATAGYLVVWYGSTAGDGNEIFGQRLDAAGQQVGADDFRISDMGSGEGASFNASDPAVAHNPIDNQFLVVWSADDNRFPMVDNEFEIFGQRLNASGQQVGAADFRISDLGGSRETDFAAERPAVVFHPGSGLFLVAWHGDDEVGGLVDGEEEIFGQFLSRDGAAVGPNDLRLSDLGGTGAPEFDAESVVLATSPGEILAVWHGDDDEGGLGVGLTEVFGQRIDTSFLVFVDGFESADTTRWSASVP